MIEKTVKQSAFHAIAILHNFLIPTIWTLRKPKKLVKLCYCLLDQSDATVVSGIIFEFLKRLQLFEKFVTIWLLYWNRMVSYYDDFTKYFSVPVDL